MQVPNDELNKAIDRWFSIQTTNPSWLDNYIYKQNGGRNPFYPWPPEKEDIDKFLFASQSFEQAAKAMTPEKRQELIEAFNEGSQKIETVRAEVREDAKKRVQDIIKHTLEEPAVAPDEKEVLFRALKDKSDHEPDRPVSEVLPAAFEAVETRRVFATETPEEQSLAITASAKFSKLRGLGVFHKNITAPVFDAITTVFPDLKQGAMNKNFEAELRGLLNAPNRLIDYLGVHAADSLAFKQMIHGVQTDMSRVSRPASAGNILGDIASNLFRGPIEATTIESVRLYWEAYRINVMRGLPPPNANQFMANGMGLGSELLRYGAGRAGRWAIGKGLTKLGIKVAAGTAGGPVGWAALAFDFAAGLLGKAGNWLKGLAIPGAGEVPGDRAILGVGCGAILLVFFILPFITQFNIDSALIGRLQMGGPGDGGSPLPPYPGAPAIPSDVTGCPTKNAFTLTQCPAGDYSHQKLWAYDVGFGGAMNMPILATHDGVVAVTTGVGQSGGYGNMVEIKGINTKGQGYYTLYGHLARWTVRPGQQVKAGSVIGYGDNTGNSSGPHLHYEYRDANNRASPSFGVQFLPAACVTNPGDCNLQ